MGAADLETQLVEPSPFGCGARKNSFQSPYEVAWLLLPMAVVLALPRWRRSDRSGKIRMSLAVFMAGGMVIGSILLLTARSGRAMGDDEEVLVYKPYWVHLNHIGAPVRLTDADGAVVWSAEYEPFGRAVALDEDPDGDGETVTMNFRFPGQYYDAETGLHYNWHRYYDPIAGRYLQADEGALYTYPSYRDILEATTSHYQYTGNNPVGFVDVLGYRTIVYIWQPVGHGVSSFGHVSVDINGTSYSFSQNGMDISDANTYYYNNKFRDAVGLELPLSDQQEKYIRCFLANYSGTPYNPIANNCTTPIQSALAGIGVNIPTTFLPTVLMKNLLNSNHVQGYHFHYATQPKKMESWDDKLPPYPWGK